MTPGGTWWLARQTSFLFMLFDLSRPMRRRSDWRLVSPGERLEQPGFTIKRLRELLE
jgi:hypothetical protein